MSIGDALVLGFVWLTIAFCIWHASTYEDRRLKRITKRELIIDAIRWLLWPITLPIGVTMMILARDRIQCPECNKQISVKAARQKKKDDEFVAEIRGPMKHDSTDR